MECRSLFESIEIVSVAGTIGRTAGGVEQGCGLVEAGIAPDHRQELLGGSTSCRGLGQPVELGDKLVPFGRLPVVERIREIPQLVDLPRAPPLQDVDGDLVEPAPGPLHRLQQVALAIASGRSASRR